jgi:hypothetical protein
MTRPRADPAQWHEVTPGEVWLHTGTRGHTIDVTRARSPDPWKAGRYVVKVHTRSRSFLCGCELDDRLTLAAVKRIAIVILDEAMRHRVPVRREP